MQPVGGADDDREAEKPEEEDAARAEEGAGPDGTRAREPIDQSAAQEDPDAQPESDGQARGPAARQARPRTATSWRRAPRRRSPWTTACRLPPAPVPGTPATTPCRPPRPRATRRRLAPRSPAIADFTASAAGSADSSVASQTPATRRGAERTRRQPVRKAPVASDVERIRHHEVLEPHEPSARPLARGFRGLRRERPAVVRPVDVEQQHLVGIHLRAHRERPADPTRRASTDRVRPSARALSSRRQT